MLIGLMGASSITVAGLVLEFYSLQPRVEGPHLKQVRRLILRHFRYSPTYGHKSVTAIFTKDGCVPCEATNLWITKNAPLLAETTVLSFGTSAAADVRVELACLRKLGITKFPFFVLLDSRLHMVLVFHGYNSALLQAKLGNGTEVKDLAANM